MNEQNECYHYSVQNNGVKEKILQITDIKFSTVNMRFSYRKHDSHNEGLCIDKLLFINVIGWFSNSLQMYNEKLKTHKPPNLTLSYWKKITKLSPEGRTAEVVLLSTQIYQCLCTRWHDFIVIWKYAFNKLFFNVWIRAYLRCWLNSGIYEGSV